MPKILDQPAPDDQKDLDRLKDLWDQSQSTKRAYDELLADLSDRLSIVQISRYTGLPRGRLISQSQKAKQLRH